MGAILRESVAGQISEYRRRFSSTKRLFEDFLQNLVVQGFSYDQAYKIARKVLKKVILAQIISSFFVPKEKTQIFKVKSH